MPDKFDLVVVGTGFASTFFLKKYLSKSKSNVRVLVLERGFLFPRQERVKHLRGESTSYSRYTTDPDQNFVNETPDKHWLFTLGFGGSSNCWYACTPRFMPSDFKMKTLFGVAQDWPVQYEDLDPYYTEVETLMDIAGPEETPFPKKSKYPLPPHKFATVDKIMKRTYGDLYISQPTGRASQAVKSRNACCTSSVCAVCPVDAKFTIENSGFGVYEDPRVEVKYGAHVYSLDLEGGIAKNVNYILESKEHSVSGEVVALGTHALFNAHILLNSGDSHPLTGKGLGEQYGMDVVVHLKDLSNVGGSTWVNANGYMLYDGPHRKDYAACLIESNNAPYIRVERGKWRDVATFRMIFEDLPQERNYVAKGDDRLKPVVHFEGISEYTKKGVLNMKEKLPQLLSCLPVEEIKFMDPFKSEAHILGTTRMSSDPASGVTDKHLIHHHYRNLFVLGSGGFTTFTPNNPTLTLSALSLYSADKSF
jgi:choline dehydrogenase-like flavoprotein